MSNKTAIVTGITGQDGSYLTEFLLKKNYKVIGLVRRSSSVIKTRIEHLYPGKNENLSLEYADMSDSSSLHSLLYKIQPDEVYNLAAQSHVRVSFDQPEYTLDVDGVGVLRLLEAIRSLKRVTGKETRFYQASTSEMFGAANPPQSETTPFYPRSPYAVSKVASYWMTINYREAYDLHASNGILFNHESERRGENFVTRKITLSAARIKLGLQKKLQLGNLDAKRDWGHARDYVRAMWLMLQQENPDDYVIATGKSYSVKDFLNEVFGILDLDWHDYVEINPYYYRPTEVEHLTGDPTKAKNVLGWEPEIGFEELVRIMVEHDLEVAKKELHMLDYKPSTNC